MSDLINRQEVLDIIKTRLYQTALNTTEYITSYDKVCEDIAENRIDTWINEAKSVEPEMEKGKWIKTYEKDDAESRTLWKCSNCNEIERRQSDYCPNCGCKMYIKTRDVIDDFIKDNL